MMASEDAQWTENKDVLMLEDEDSLMTEDMGPQSTELEPGVKYILEAGVKAKCNFQLITRALIIYHNFMRSIDNVPYDPAMVAAAALRLSSKVENADLDIDGLVFLFYHMVNGTVDTLYPGSVKFDVLKKSLITVKFIMLRMLNFTLKYSIAHQYLVPFLNVLASRAIFTDKFFEIMGVTCMKYINDFYTNRMCLNYKPEDICIACIDAALHFHGFVRHMYVLHPWHEGFSADLTEAKVKEMRRNILRLYKPHYTKKLFGVVEDSSPEKQNLQE